MAWRCPGPFGLWSTRPSGCNPAHKQPARAVGSYVLSWPRDEWEQVGLDSLECWLPCPPCFRVWLGYRIISFVLCLEATWQRCGVRGNSGQLCVLLLFLWMTSVALYCEVCLAGVPEHVPAGVPPVPPKVLVLLPCSVFKRLRIFVRAEKIAGLGARGPLNVAPMQRTHCNPDVVALHCMHARCYPKENRKV